MDSTNSGSLQSSSGADEESDSRAVIQDSAGFMAIHHHQPHPPPPPPCNHHIVDQNQINNPLLFRLSPQHELLNLDSVVWSKTLPFFSDHQFLPSSSQPAAYTVPFPTVNTPTTEPLTTTNPPPPPRNPKKRSRASRRAPTTVLTTDTSNFRAMVQEFTGIPAPPFTSSLPAFPSLATSFDLFGRPAAMMRSNSNNFDNLPQLLPYLLRPFPQPISSLLESANLVNTMQKTISFPSNSLNQSSYLNQKTAQNDASSNGFGVIGQTQIHGLHPTYQTLFQPQQLHPQPQRQPQQ